MAYHSTSGSTRGLSMAEFNARAKKIAAATGEIQKGSSRTPTNRFRRDATPAPRKPAEGPAES